MQRRNTQTKGKNVKECLEKDKIYNEGIVRSLEKFKNREAKKLYLGIMNEETRILTENLVCDI